MNDIIDLLAHLYEMDAVRIVGWGCKLVAMTRRRIEPLVLRAKLIGAYRRRDDLTARGEPLDDVEARIVELEADADPDLVAEAQRLAGPAGATTPDYLAE